MYRSNLITAVAVIILATACNNSQKEETGPYNSVPPSLERENEADPTFSTLEAVKYQELATTIRFNEFRLDIHNFSTFDEEDLQGKVETDTVTISSDIGEDLSRSTLIISDELTSVTVEQRYETSVTIMNEGPHCDMTEWKHYTSKWKTLPSKGKNIFECLKYSDKEQEKFPEVTLEEFKEAVKKYCGDLGTQQIKNVKSPTDYPGGVGISTMYIRISGTEKTTGKAVLKYLVFDIPMGC